MRRSNCLKAGLLLSLTSVALSAGVTPVAAQEVRSNTQRLLIAPRLTGSSFEVEDGDQESGGGAGLSLGWGVSRHVALFLGGDITDIEIRNPDFDGSFFLVLVDLGVRVSFRGPQHRFIPYAVGALTGMSASAEVSITPFASSEVELTGGGITLGGGFQYYFIPTLALDVQVLGTGGSLTNIRIGSISRDVDDIDATAGRFTVGVAWYPLQGR